jgi:hypothetical protein
VELSSEKIASIISGEFSISVHGKSFVYKQPGLMTINKVLRRYGNIEENLKKDGFLTEEEEKKLLYEKGLWSDELEEMVRSSKETIIQLSSAIVDAEFRSVEKNFLTNKKRELEKLISKLNSDKNTFIYQTIAYNKIKLEYMYLLPYTIFLNGNKYWNTVEEFDNDTDSGLINEIINAVSGSFYSEAEIRKMARSEPWRSMWKTYSKGGGQLFDCPIADMCRSQRDLCYWSNIYDNVFDSHERPDWSIIDDDSELDIWFENQYNKATKTASSGPISMNPKIANAKEVFVVAETPKDAEKVYSKMNTSAALSDIKQRNKTLLDSGVMAEYQLPDVKVDIQMQQNRNQMQ